MPWDCLANAFLYYRSRKDVSNSIATIHNSNNFTYRFTNLLYMMRMYRNRPRRDFHISCYGFFGCSYWFNRHTFAVNAAAGAISSWSGCRKFVAIAAALRTWRWSGLVVMVMGELFCVCVREGWVMRDFEREMDFSLAGFIEICAMSIRVLNNRTLW